MKRNFRIAVGLLSLVAATQAQAVVVFSEDFETLNGYTKSSTFFSVPPVITTYVDLFNGDSFQTAANGTWAVLGNPASGVDLVGSAYAADFFGQYAVDLAGSPGPGSIKKSGLALTANSYQITFWLKPAGSLSDISTFDVKVNGVSQSFSNVSSNYYTFNFTGSISDLEFISNATNNGNLFFDNLSVEAVPEPFTMALGAAGLALALKRRAKKTAKA
ncbi:MAG: hypothetical protein H7Y17_12945 [Chlorobia bacterium]|nr:hypothetical protein [Fimbriimonadaceae bacterium]